VTNVRKQRVLRAIEIKEQIEHFHIQPFDTFCTYSSFTCIFIQSYITYIIYLTRNVSILFKLIRTLWISALDIVQVYIHIITEKYQELNGKLF